MGVPGFEPGTSSLSEMRSNQLSYTPAEKQGWLAAIRHCSLANPGGGWQAYALCLYNSLTGVNVMKEMVLYGISFDVIGKQPIILLKTADANKFLPIWIGHQEAAAILMKLQGTDLPRPMTHDLMTSILDELHAEVLKVTVTELKENTFYALLTLKLDNGEVEVDSRPSDALALAVRTNAPIFAADQLIEDNAIEFDHEVEDADQVVEKFRDFLDNVTPEDFLND